MANATERAWNAVSVESLDLAVPDTLQAMNPVAVRVFDSEVFVLDHGNVSAMRYDLNGRFLAKIGSGAGMAPGELTLPSDLYVRNDSVWLPSIKGGLVFRFRTDGSYIDQFRAVAPLRLTGFGADLVTLNFSTPQAFGHYTADGTERGGFGQLIDDQTVQFLSLSGHVRESESRDGFYYAPSYAGLVYKFDLEGSLQMLVERVEPHPFPNVSNAASPGGGVGVRLSEKPSTVLVSFSEDRGLWYLHMGLRDSEGRPDQSVLDIYDASTGAYRSTVALPEMVFDLDVHAGTVYYINGEGLHAWRLRKATAS